MKTIDNAPGLRFCAASRPTLPRPNRPCRFADSFCLAHSKISSLKGHESHLAVDPDLHTRKYPTALKCKSNGLPSKKRRGTVQTCRSIN